MPINSQAPLCGERTLGAGRAPAGGGRTWSTRRAGRPQGWSTLTELESEYRLLGLEDGASFAEVRNAFRRLAKRWHPDAPNGDRERFEAICAAHRHIARAYALPVTEEARPLTEHGRLEAHERRRLDSRAVFEALPPAEQRTLIRRGYSELLHRTLSGESEAEAARALAALNWPAYLVERIIVEQPEGASVVVGSRHSEGGARPGEPTGGTHPRKRRGIFSGR